MNAKTKTLREVSSLYQEFTGLNQMQSIMDIESGDEAFKMAWKALLADQGSCRAHDFVGIHNHLDRKTYPAKMGGCFVPRFARR